MSSRITMWRGVSTGRWWGMIPEHPRLVSAPTREALGLLVDSLLYTRREAAGRRHTAAPAAAWGGHHTAQHAASARGITCQRAAGRSGGCTSVSR